MPCAAQSQGDLEQQFDEAQQRLEALNRTSAADLAKLRLWSGSLADLARLPLPSAETIERIAAQMAACENSRTALAGSLQAAEDRKSAIGRQLDELRLQGEVPSEGDLAAAAVRAMRVGSSSPKPAGKPNPTRSVWPPSWRTFPASKD